VARIKSSPWQLGMVEFDAGALIKLFPCAGRQGLIEARNREEGVAGVVASARSGGCVVLVRSLCKQLTGGSTPFRLYEKNTAFICSSLEPHLRQWTRGGSADSGSKKPSSDWTTVDEIDRYR
jgi:hypothetical protein